VKQCGQSWWSDRQARELSHAVDLLNDQEEDKSDDQEMMIVWIKTP